MCSLVLAFIDSYTRVFADLRKGISWVVNPVYVVAEIPYGLVRGINGFLAPRVNLINENKDLRGRNLKLQQMVIHYQSLDCLLYTSPSPRDGLLSRMPSSA